MLPGDSFDALLQVITAVRTASTQAPLKGTVVTKDHRGGSRTAEAFVDRGNGLWRLDEDNRSVSYDPDNGVIFYGSTADESPGKDRKDWLPAEVSLFHPLQMRIWGASMDDWRIVSADLESRFARLSLVNTFDSDFTGYALVDLEFGVVVEIERPPVKMTLTDLHVSIAVQDGS